MPGRVSEELGESIGISPDQLDNLTAPQLDAMVGRTAEEREAMERFGRGVATVAEIVGSLVGGAAGGRAARGALPLGRFLLRTGGAGLGGAGTAAPLAGEEEGPGPAAARGFIEGALGEIGGPAIQGGLRLIEAPLKRLGFGGMRFRVPALLKTEPGASEALTLLQQRGATLSLAQTTDNFLVDQVESVARRGLGSAGVVEAQAGLAQKTAEDLIDEFIGSYRRAGGQRHVETGRLVNSALRDEAAAYNVFTAVQYAKLDAAWRAGLGRTVGVTPPVGGGAAALPVNFNPVVSAAGLALTEAERGLKVKGSATVDMLRSGLEDLAQRPAFVSFEEASLVRGDLLALKRASRADPLGGRFQHHLNKLVGEIDSTMEASAMRLGLRETQLWRRANSVARIGKERFNESVVADLINDTNPEDVYRQVAALGPTQAKLTRKVVERGIRQGRVKPDTWAAVQGEMLNDAFRQAGGATERIGGDVLGETASAVGKKFLKQLDGFGEETLEAFLSKREIRDIRLLGRALELSESVPKGRLGTISIGFLQGSAFANLMLGDPLAAGGRATATIFLAPIAIAKTLTNPTLVRLLTQGAVMRPGTLGASRIVSQTLAHMLDEGIITPQDVRKAEDMQHPPLESVRPELLAPPRRP